MVTALRRAPDRDFLTTEQLAQIVLESIRRMTPEEKAEVRTAFNRAYGRDFTAADLEFLRQIGITASESAEPSTLLLRDPLAALLGRRASPVECVTRDATRTQ
jgi:hypothetical protein